MSQIDFLSKLSPLTTPVLVDMAGSQKKLYESKSKKAPSKTTELRRLKDTTLTREALRKAILLYVPENGERIGNANLLDKLKIIWPDITKNYFQKEKDSMISDSVLKRDRGKGGSVKLYNSKLVGKEANSKDVRRPSLKISAVLMKDKNDDQPEYLGRRFLEENDDYHQALANTYMRISSNYRNTEDGEFIACSHCLQPVSIRGSKNSIRIMVHRRNADAFCPIKKRNADRSSYEAEKYKDIDENLSEIHEKEVHYIADKIQSTFKAPLENDFSSGYSLYEPVRLGKRLYADQGLSYQNPDISFSLIDKLGFVSKWAIEVQRSTIRKDLIEKRTQFFRENRVNVLWVLIDDLEHSLGKEVSRAFGHIHRGGQFLMNEEAKNVSLERGGLWFIVRYIEYGLSDDEGNPIFVPKKVIPLRFPHDFVIKNHIVFHEDVLSNSILEAAKSRRTKLSKIFKKLRESNEESSRATGRLSIDSYSSACKKASELIDDICRECNLDFPDSGKIRINDKIWNTISVIFTMLARLVRDDVKVNYTNCFSPSGIYIIKFKIKESIYVSMVEYFCFYSGYLDWHNEKFSDTVSVTGKKEPAFLEYESFSRSEKILFNFFFPEFCSFADRKTLDEVGALPFWVPPQLFLNS